MASTPEKRPNLKAHPRAPLKAKKGLSAVDYGAESIDEGSISPSSSPSRRGVNPRNLQTDLDKAAGHKK